MSEENKKCLILEVYSGSRLSQLNESQVNVPDGMMRVSGVFAVIGIKNRNGRIYDKDNYKSQLQSLQADIADGLYGELEHPAGFTINNNNISHKIESVWYDEATNEVKGTLLLLDTEKGRIAQSIIKSGGSLRVSSRAMGSVNEKSVALIDKLVTFDIVGTPGFKETNLHLSENWQLLSSDDLCESFVFFPNKENPISINKQTPNTMSRNKSISLVEAKLAEIRAGRSMNESAVTKSWLLNQYAPGVQKWLFEDFSPVIMNWMLEEFAPLYEQYTKRKAINESLSKPSCSFAAFAKMKMNESLHLNESQQDQNIVLTQEEQEAVQKLSQGQQLSNKEQQLAQSGCDKLNQVQQQQQKIQESYAPENGTIVLTQDEQEAVQKLQEGQELEPDELKQAQQAVQKLQQAQQQKAQQQKVDEGLNPENGTIVLTQDQKEAVQKLQEGQQLDPEELKQAQEGVQKLQQAQQQKAQQQKVNQDDDQDKQQLRESLETKLARKNNMLSESYKLLMESEDKEEQEQISEDIDKLKQSVDNIQEKLDTLDEGQQGKQKQSEQFQQALQKVQDGDELNQEDIDALSEDELQDILDTQKIQQDGDEGEQQKKQNEGASNFDDPEDAKVFENDEQKPLPEDDDKVNESLLQREARQTIKTSGSLLESIQARMNAAKKK